MALRSIHPRGFTLLELVLVMVIITVILAAAAPSMSGFAMGRRTQDTTLEMLSVLREARSRAIANAQTYRVLLNQPAQDQYQAYVLEEGTPVATGDKFGQARQMPMDTHFAVTRLDGGPVEYLDFYPSGRVDVASIMITPPRGQPTRIVCDSPTEGYRIANSEEQSR